MTTQDLSEMDLQFRPLTAPAVLSKSSTACTTSGSKGGSPPRNGRNGHFATNGWDDPVSQDSSAVVHDLAGMGQLVLPPLTQCGYV